MFVKLTFIIYVALVLFLITDAVKKSFEVGVEFTAEEFKPEYEDLKNAETKRFVQKVSDAVSAIL